MLEILPSRGRKAFSIFVQALKEDYDWLADSLEDEASSGYYELNTRNLAIPIERCAYENEFDNLKEEKMIRVSAYQD